MAEISRAILFGKLNALAYKAIESATVFCKLRGNPYVELIHWVNQILQLQDSDIHRIAKYYDFNPARLAQDLTAAIDRLPGGATAISNFSPHVVEVVERAWVYATLMFGQSQIRSGHLLYAALQTPSLRTVVLGMSREFAKVRGDALGEDFAKIVAGSPEDRLSAYDGSQLAPAQPGEASDAMAPAPMGKQEALRRFSTDLTEKARNGEIDPVVGRDDEIRQIMDILMRRRQNNPIITGEAGVGKTAVVEGFALRIARGDVPPPMQDVSLRVLDVGLLQAGASMKGEFENRLRQVIDEVQSSPQPIILFIDEVHTLIGAGGAAGTGDAANLLKPALARGALRTIGATTWAEYKKYIEKDPALTRRFQPVQVEEPSETKALLMMRGVASTLEAHHKVQLLDEALEAAVKLSHRYIPARQLPDKAVALLDTACARVAISQYAVPPPVEDSRRRIEALTTELAIIDREGAIGVDVARRRTDAKAALGDEQARLAALDERWLREKALVEAILSLRAKLRGRSAPVEGTASPLEKETAAVIADAPVTAAPVAGDDAGLAPLTAAEREEALARLRELQAELAAAQGEEPLILVSVDEPVVAKVVEDWTGIPVGRMVKNEIEAILKLEETLRQRVVGQDQAMETIARRIRTSRAGLEDPGKPIGVFLLCGPSGVGKTETALALAEALYGGEDNVVTINMSEYQEAHTVSTLKGSPPGYVGYGEGGVLTEAVRRRPYSVVLLDEVEKAHPDVHEIFFQIFDKGWMDDAEGRRIDFKNTLILLTSNVGSDLTIGMCKDPELLPEPAGLAEALRAPLLKVFPAALLGRLIVIPYYPLSDAMIGMIARLQLDRVARRIAERHGVPFTYDDAVVTLIASRCTELESGGRMIDAILTNTLLPALSGEFLTRMLEGRPVAGVRISEHGNDFCYRFDQTITGGS
ncbi:MAG: type VI secretion system ATPase TssH [Rhodospirillales bacterium]